MKRIKTDRVKVKRARGYITEATNPDGTKQPVAIVQRGMTPGFSVIQYKKPYRLIKGGFRNDVNAVKWAIKQGHKRVVVMS